MLDQKPSNQQSTYSPTGSISGVARISQWGRGWRGSGGGAPAAGGHFRRGFGDKASNRRRQGDLGAEPPALGDFCNFSIKITYFYAYFGQNSYFKAITYQLKAFKSNQIFIILA